MFSGDCSEGVGGEAAEEAEEVALDEVEEELEDNELELLSDGLISETHGLSGKRVRKALSTELL